MQGPGSPHRYDPLRETEERVRTEQEIADRQAALKTEFREASKEVTGWSPPPPPRPSDPTPEHQRPPDGPDHPPEPAAAALEADAAAELQTVTEPTRPTEHPVHPSNGAENVGRPAPEAVEPEFATPEERHEAVEAAYFAELDSHQKAGTMKGWEVGNWKDRFENGDPIARDKAEEAWQSKWRSGEEITDRKQNTNEGEMTDSKQAKLNALRASGKFGPDVENIRDEDLDREM